MIRNHTFFVVIKNELLNNPNADTDYIVNAMINNYRSKIDILEKVLIEYKTEQTNKQKIDLNDEKVDI